jgi:hypothetical protein
MSAFFNRGQLRRFETLYLPGEQERIIGFSGYVTRPPQARRDTLRRIAFCLTPVSVISLSLLAWTNSYDPKSLNQENNDSPLSS